MKKVFGAFLVLIVTSLGIQAAELEHVASIGYEDLRGKLKDLAPDYDYGDRSVRLWADVEGDCFETSDDVVGVFDNWLGLHDQTGQPRELEIRCKPWHPGKSIVVIAEYSTRNQPPQSLWIFAASADGARLDELLFEDRPGGGMRIQGYSLEFALDGGRVTSLLLFQVYPEQIGSKEWISTRIYRVGDDRERLRWEASGAYRVVEGEAVSFQVLTVTSENFKPTWQLREVSAEIKEGAVAEFRSWDDFGEVRVDEDQPSGLTDVLKALAELKRDPKVETVFESFVVSEYLALLTGTNQAE